jgi:SOS-response transcriptional repressor LexA
MKQVTLAQILKVSQQRLQGWEAGKHDPPPEKINEAARALEVPTAYLTTGKGEPGKETGTPLYPVSFPVVQIAYGGFVPAGDWIDPFETEDLVEVDAKFDAPGRFAARIEGSSMFPLLHPDDLAIFQTYTTRRPQIGHVVLARRSHDNFVTVKQLAHDGQEFMLRALNPAHEDAVAPQWESIGFLIGIIRKRGSYQRSDYNPEGIRVTDTLTE